MTVGELEYDLPLDSALYILYNSIFVGLEYTPVNWIPKTLGELLLDTDRIKSDLYKSVDALRKHPLFEERKRNEEKVSSAIESLLDDI